MRGTLALLTGIIAVSLALTGCNGSGTGTAKKLTPTPTPTRTVEQILVNTQDLPGGCTLQGEGSQFQGYFERSFDCGEIRLTNAVGFLKSQDEARVLLSNSWGTRDGFLDLVRPSVASRPTDTNSLRVEDVTQTLPKLGADEEKLYCITFTDASGAQPVTEYWGGYRYQSVFVQYTASALTSGSCDNASRLPQLARILASAQLAKLRAGMR